MKAQSKPNIQSIRQLYKRQITRTNSYLRSSCNGAFLVAGSSSAFHHVYEGAILASRQPGATPAERALGETRASELNRVTSMFILRRTQEINTKYLPPKGTCDQTLQSSDDSAQQDLSWATPHF